MALKTQSGSLIHQDSSQHGPCKAVTLVGVQVDGWLLAIFVFDFDVVVLILTTATTTTTATATPAAATSAGATTATILTLHRSFCRDCCFR